MKVIVLTRVTEQKAQFQEGLLWKSKFGLVLELTEKYVDSVYSREEPVILLEINNPRTENNQVSSYSMIVRKKSSARVSKKAHLRRCWTTTQEKIYTRHGHAFFEVLNGLHGVQMLNKNLLEIDPVNLESYPSVYEEKIDKEIIKTIFGINPKNTEPTVGNAKLWLYLILDQMRLNENINELDFSILAFNLIRFLNPHQERFFFGLLNNQDNGLFRILKEYLSQMWEKYPDLILLNNQTDMSLDFLNHETVFAQISYTDIQHEYNRISIERLKDKIIPKIIQLAPVTF